jgi:DME family drug/metabolite transporter
MEPTTPVPDPAAVSRGRLCILLAALIWSTSGAFTKVLTLDTPLGLNQPVITPAQMACFRALFAAAALATVVNVRTIRFRPLMLVMAACFALMNVTFVTAQALGSAANAILLQYTAPMWTYLACVWWLGEPRDIRSRNAIVIGSVGILVIVAGGWQESQLDVIALGLFSGSMYAGVLVCLRVLREASPQWLILLNHAVGGLVLLPFVLILAPPQATAAQWIVLFLFGALQMAVPYFLMARGLHTVSPQEAGTITLLEPLLNPLWAFLVAGEVPSSWSFVGGAFILGALLWRYWPGRQHAT